MKSTFMNEIYELEKEISLLPSLSDRNQSKESENSHTTNVLETKLVFLEKQFLYLILLITILMSTTTI